MPSGPVVATPETAGAGGATGELDAFFIDKYEVTNAQYLAFLDDLVATIQPRYAKLTAVFNVRGGVYTTVEAEHRKDD